MVIYKLREFGADFLLLLVAVAWGGTFFIVQDAIKEVPVYTFLFWRFGIAALFMSVISYRSIRKIDKRTLFSGGVLGLFMFFGFAFQTFGLTYTYSSTVAFITGLNVIIVPFVLLAIFGKKASLFSILGAVFALVGLYFLTKVDGMGFGKGEIYALVCAFMFALHIVFTDRYSKEFDVISLVAVQFWIVTILSAVFALLFDKAIIPQTFSMTFIWALVATVLFATIFAFWVQTSMQRFTTPAKTAIIFTLEPVSAGIFGYYFAGEDLGGRQIFGALLIVTGMLVAELGAYLRKSYGK